MPSSEVREYYGCPKGSLDATNCSFVKWCKQPQRESLEMGDAAPNTEIERHSVVVGEQKSFRSTNFSQEKSKDQHRHSLCFQCGEHGHLAKECPRGGHKDEHGRPEEILDTNKNASSSGTCFYCKEPGHFAAECPKKQKDALVRNTCYRCKQVGHWASECPNKKVSGQKRTTNLIPSGGRKPIEKTGMSSQINVQEEREPDSSGKRNKTTDAMDMPPPKRPSIHLFTKSLLANIDVKKLPLSMRGGGSYTRE